MRHTRFVYNSNPLLATSGSEVDALADGYGRLHVIVDNDAVDSAPLYKNITTQTTTLVKTGMGVLHSIVVNKAVASGVITIYDNTSAGSPIIATITMPGTLHADQIVLKYDCAFTTGLTIVTSGAAQDITVTYS